MIQVPNFHANSLNEFIRAYRSNYFNDLIPIYTYWSLLIPVDPYLSFKTPNLSLLSANDPIDLPKLLLLIIYDLQVTPIVS